MFANGFRTVLVILAAALLTLPAAAQETPIPVPRAIAGLYDNFSGGNVIRVNMPDFADGLNISAHTMEVSEPGASCTSSPLSNSAWFKIFHPGGTLDINTAFGTGTGFDSVVQLFAANTGSIAALNELGCDNDSGGGSSNNDARLVMPNLASDTYFARITCIALCAGTTDLALSVTYTPDETPPPNDSIAAAKAIKIGKAKLTKKAQHTTVAATENSTLTCPIYNSVWYTMTVPFDGSYSFSSYGSVLNRNDLNPADTRMAVYVSSGGPIFANLTEKGCNDDYGSVVGYGALPAITLTAGEEVYVRVGTFSSANLLHGSYYRLKTTIVNLNNVLINGSFETGSLAPWSMKITSGLEGVVNTYSSSGTHSARMLGEPGKVNKLKQKWSTGNIKLPKDGMVVALLSYSTNGTESNKAFAILKMAFTNGAPAQTFKYRLNSYSPPSYFQVAYLQLPVKAPNVKDLTLMIKNKSSGGALFIDEVSVRIFGDPTRAAKQSLDLLPVPEAPPLTLRGAN